MTNIVEILKPALDVASKNPWVAGGMVAGGVLLIIGGQIFDRFRKRKAKNESSGKNHL